MHRFGNLIFKGIIIITMGGLKVGAFAAITADQAEKAAKEYFLEEYKDILRKDRINEKYVIAERKKEIEENIIYLQLDTGKESQQFYYVFDVQEAGCTEIKENRYECTYATIAYFLQVAVSKSSGKVFNIHDRVTARDDGYNSFIKGLDIKMESEAVMRKYLRFIEKIDKPYHVPIVTSVLDMKYQLQNCFFEYFKDKQGTGDQQGLEDTIGMWTKAWMEAYKSEEQNRIPKRILEDNGNSFTIKKTKILCTDDYPVAALHESKTNIALDGSIIENNTDRYYPEELVTNDLETGKKRIMTFRFRFIDVE